MRNLAALALILSGLLMACSGSETSTLSKSDEAFLQSVHEQAVSVPQAIIGNDDIDPRLKDLAKQAEATGDRLAVESQALLGEVNRSIQSNESAQAVIAEAEAAIDQSEAKTQAKAWIEAVIKQREALLQAAQEQIDTSSNSEVVALAEKVKAEQSALVEQLRAQLDALSK